MIYATGLAILGCLHLGDVVDLSAPRVSLLASPIFISAVICGGLALIRAKLDRTYTSATAAIANGLVK